jgi:hypothetical protein
MLKLPAVYCGCNSESFACCIQNQAPVTAATQALSSGDVPTDVALHAAFEATVIGTDTPKSNNNDNNNNNNKTRVQPY